jgi:hypothetical protein
MAAAEARPGRSLPSRCARREWQCLAGKSKGAGLAGSRNLTHQGVYSGG